MMASLNVIEILTYSSNSLCHKAVTSAGMLKLQPNMSNMKEDVRVKITHTLHVKGLYSKPHITKYSLPIWLLLLLWRTYNVCVGHHQKKVCVYVEVIQFQTASLLKLALLT